MTVNVHSTNIKEAMALRGLIQQVMNSLFADNKKCLNFFEAEGSS
jgi:hypothetical protein